MSDKKSTTVRDLKTFIDAVEFASDQEEWVPSARQWKRIRDMINSLEESKAAPVPVQHTSQAPPQYPNPQFAMPPMPPMMAQPSGLVPQGMPQMPAQLPNNPLLARHDQMPVRTPDIDTGHGKPYQSSFAD